MENRRARHVVSRRHGARSFACCRASGCAVRMRMFAASHGTIGGGLDGCSVAMRKRASATHSTSVHRYTRPSLWPERQVTPSQGSRMQLSVPDQRPRETRPCARRVRGPSVVSVVACVVAAAAPATAQSPGERSVTAIVNASVVPMDAERILARHTVIVEGERIAWVGPAAAARVPASARVIDAAGRFVVPGLTDAHVHLSPSEFPLLLRHGVTTIVQMHGTPEHLTWRAQLRDGTMDGPTMLTTGPVVAGQRPGFPFFVLATTGDEGRRVVGEQRSAGYDFVKVYDGLSPETYDAVVAAADNVGQLVVGHAPMAVGLGRVTHSGQRLIVHTDQVFYALHRQRDGVMTLPPEAVDRALAAWRGSNAAFTPTLAGLEIDYRRGSAWVDSLIARPDTEHLARIWGSAWMQTARVYATRPDSARRETRLHFLSLLAGFTRRADSAGILLVAGTDTPNGLLVPGLSLHDELAAYVRAGLSPYRALRTATVNPGIVFGTSDPFGRIVTGARADLLIVRGNPLETLAALRHPDVVMARGRVMERR